MILSKLTSKDKLPKEKRNEWYKQLEEKLKEYNKPENEFYFIGSKTYIKPLLSKFKINIIGEGLKIGEKIKYLKEKVEQNKL